jgi:2-hydroxychromene-2-carboxylate isomerase
MSLDSAFSKEFPVRHQLDFFFFIGSIYAYLASMRIGDLASRAGVTVNWRPFSVRDIMIEQDNLPRHQPTKMAYMWRDSERRARRNGVPYAGRPPHPIDPDQRANRVATFAKTEGWCEDFSRAAFRTWFLDAVAVGGPGTLEPIIAALGHDPAHVLARADDDDIRALYSAETDVARQAGGFGSPTFIVNGEMFWGDDRLEEAIAWATGEHPAQG